MSPLGSHAIRLVGAGDDWGPIQAEERKKECAVPKVDIKVEKRGERRMLFSADLRWENLEDSMDWNSVAKACKPSESHRGQSHGFDPHPEKLGM